MASLERQGNDKARTPVIEKVCKIVHLRLFEQHAQQLHQQS